MQYFSNEYLEHHGIRGQKWGVRRYQNSDGSLTSAGKKRIRTKDEKLHDSVAKKHERIENKLEKKRNAIKGDTAKDVYKRAKLKAAIDRNRRLKDIKDFEIDIGGTYYERFKNQAIAGGALGGAAAYTALFGPVAAPYGSLAGAGAGGRIAIRESYRNGMAANRTGNKRQYREDIRDAKAEYKKKRG